MGLADFARHMRLCVLGLNENIALLDETHAAWVWELREEEGKGWGLIDVR